MELRVAALLGRRRWRWRQAELVRGGGGAQRRVDQVGHQALAIRNQAREAHEACLLGMRRAADVIPEAYLMDGSGSSSHSAAIMAMA